MNIFDDNSQPDSSPPSLQDEISGAFGAMGNGLKEAGEARALELAARQGYVGFRKDAAAEAFRRDHPDWGDLVVNGETRFFPPGVKPTATMGNNPDPTPSVSVPARGKGAIDEAKVDEAVRSQGYFATRGQNATKAFKRDHPGWDSIIVNGETRFFPPGVKPTVSLTPEPAPVVDRAAPAHPSPRRASNSSPSPAPPVTPPVTPPSAAPAQPTVDNAAPPTPVSEPSPSSVVPPDISPGSAPTSPSLGSSASPPSASPSPTPAPPSPSPAPPSNPPAPPVSPGGSGNGPGTPTPPTPPPGNGGSGNPGSGGNGSNGQRAPIVQASSRYEVTAGDTIRISGRNLRNPTSVTVGGHPVSVRESSNSYIYFDIPTPAIGGLVTVTNSAGSDTLARPLTVQPAPPGGGGGNGPNGPGPGGNGPGGGNNGAGNNSFNNMFGSGGVFTPFGGLFGGITGIIVQVATGVVTAAQRSGIQFPALGGLSDIVWKAFSKAMNEVATDVVNKAAANAGSGGLGNSRFGKLFEKGASKFGGFIGGIAGQLGLTQKDADGNITVPTGVAGAIAGGTALMAAATISNIKESVAVGRASSQAFTDGLMSGMGAITDAAQHLVGQIVQTITAPFGKMGSGVAGGVSQIISSITSIGSALAGLGAEARKAFAGWGAGAVTAMLAAIGIGIGAIWGGLGMAIGALVGSLLGLGIAKLLGFFANAIGKAFDFAGKALGEIFKVGGQALETFVKVISDAAEAAMSFAAAARSLSNKTGMGDAVSGKFLDSLGLLGLSRRDAAGMMGNDLQVFRSMKGLPWGLQGMPTSGDADPNLYLRSVYEKAQQWKQMGGPMFGTMFQQMMLNSSGNSQLLDAVNLSPKAFNQRLDFANQFPSMSAGAINSFQEDFGTLQAEISHFVEWIKTSFGADLLPFLQEIFSGVVTWVIANKDDIVGTLKGIAGWIYQYGPFLIVGGLRAIASGIAVFSDIFGKILVSFANHLPDMLKVFDAIANAFRNLMAMGSGFAAAAQAIANGNPFGALKAYRQAQAAFLKNVPASNLAGNIDPKLLANLQQMLRGVGQGAQNLAGSLRGTKTVNPLTDNAISRLDDLLKNLDPSQRTQVFQQLTNAVQANTAAQTAPKKLNVDMTVAPTKQFFVEVTAAMIEADERDLSRQGM